MMKKHATEIFKILVLSLTVSLATGATFFSQAMAETPGFTASTAIATNGTQQRRIYTDISRGSATAPIVLLLNGLIYDIERWNPVAESLAKQDLTVIRMSFSPQPESLKLLEDGETPSFYTRGLELSVLAEDVRAVLSHHGVKKAVTVVGLSYGATVATEFTKLYPRRVSNLILLSPLVVSLDTYNPASAPLRAMLEGVRFWEDAPCHFYGWLNPWLCSSTDFWYDSFYNYFFESYLNQRVTAVPADIDSALYKKSVFQLVRAVRNYDLKKEVASLKNIHMLVAQNDEPNLLADQRLAWSLVPQKLRRSFAEVTNVAHALPDEAPWTTASWIHDIVMKKPGLGKGQEYIVEGK